MAELLFSVWDYVVIVAMLLVPVSIGLFFAFSHHGRQETSEEYFLGSRRMNVIAVITSMVVTTMSAGTYISVPGEVYLLGPQFGLMFVSKFLCSFLVSTFFVPVLYRLRFVSIFQYYEARFSKPVTYCLLISSLVHGLLVNGVFILVPSLALATISGTNLYLSIIAVGVVCTFYTTIGGFKAVIWTDAFQALIILIGFMMMITVGTVRVGGAREVWRIAEEGGRTQLVNFNPDPTIAYTFWSIMVGGTLFYTMVNGATQIPVQRYNSCKTEGQAKLVVWFGTIGMGVAELLGVITGMVLYAYYAYCDPITSGRIASHDQLVALFVMDLFHETPGLSGVAIAGAFCATLSTVSSIINGTSAGVGETIVKGFCRDISEVTYTRVNKLISALVGLISICLGVLATFMGGALQMILGFGGIFGGPSLGVLSLGIFVPRADARSALCGMIASVAICLSLDVSSRVTGAQAQLNPLPLSMEECGVTSSNGSVNNMRAIRNEYSTPNTPEENQWFALSPLHYSTMSTLITIVVGILVSYLPGNQGSMTCDPSHLTPIIKRYHLKRQERSCVQVELTGVTSSDEIKTSPNDTMT